MSFVRVLVAIGLLSGLATVAGAAPFLKADANHDGVVTYKDAKRVLPQLTEVNFEKFDANHDGLVDKREWTGLDNFYTVLYREN